MTSWCSLRELGNVLTVHMKCISIFLLPPPMQYGVSLVCIAWPLLVGVKALVYVNTCMSLHNIGSFVLHN